ncbi:MAG: bacillithiol biosynthesis deacetylase BshB1 [Planctomycetota bacterium]|nr:MAG: bacillithiol biosynthesis deacetylase BshB1 [Planctomycetota bacterium]
MLDALVIAPHPDDAELGMGGTIALMLSQGMRVGVLDLTDGEPTPLGSPLIRARETAAASDVLGIPWRENLGLPNRSLRATLPARAALAAVIRRTRPRWLFSPHWVDAHPDHLATTKLVDAARFWAKLTKCDLPGEPWHPARVYHYPCVHLKVLAKPAFIVDITPTWTLKAQSIACYASQFPTSAPSPTVPERVEASASWWGAMIGVAHGEPFTSREPIGLRGFGDLF